MMQQKAKLEKTKKDLDVSSKEVKQASGQEKASENSEKAINPPDPVVEAIKGRNKRSQSGNGQDKRLRPDNGQDKKPRPGNDQDKKPKQDDGQGKKPLGAISVGSGSNVAEATKQAIASLGNPPGPVQTVVLQEANGKNGAKVLAIAGG